MWFYMIYGWLRILRARGGSSIFEVKVENGQEYSPRTRR